MDDHAPRPIVTADVSPGTPLSESLLALNNAHAQELSWLEPERLEHLVRETFLARRIGGLDAFLLAFDQDAAYDSPNFLWFRERYSRFVYVDRIVVASSHAAAAARESFIRNCSNMHRAPAMGAWCARSTRARLIRSRMLFIKRWVLSKSVPPASTMAPRPCAICRARCRNSLDHRPH